MTMTAYETSLECIHVTPRYEKEEDENACGETRAMGVVPEHDGLVAAVTGQWESWHVTSIVLGSAEQLAMPGVPVPATVALDTLRGMVLRAGVRLAVVLQCDYANQLCKNPKVELRLTLPK